MRERALSGGRPTTQRGDPTDGARIDVSSIALTSPAQWRSDRVAAFHRPDDGNEHDRNGARASRSRTRSSRAVRRRSTSRGPRTCRTDRAHRRHRQLLLHRAVVSQARRPAGRGWNCHQFHAATEFFSDYGVYDVSLTVPHGWPLGATGVERERATTTPTARRRTATIRRTCTTSRGRRVPTIVERTATFEHPTLPPVDMRLLLQPEHDRQADRHFRRDADDAEVLRRVVRRLPIRPHHHRRSRVCRAAPAAWSIRRSSPPARAGWRRRASPTPEGVTVHEAGHQFWYGMVGNNEFEARVDGRRASTPSPPRGPSRKCSIRITSPSAISAASCRGCFSDRRDRAARRTAIVSPGIAAMRKATRSRRRQFRYFPATGGSITYNKTALWLNTMERLARVADAAAHHVDVLQRIGVQASEARRLLPCRDPAWRGPTSRGFRSGASQSRTSSTTGSRICKSTRERRSLPDHGRRSPLRRGGVSVDVLVTFENGERVTEHWDGRERWTTMRVRAAGGGAARPGRSEPRAAAGREPHATTRGRCVRRGAAAATKWSAKWHGLAAETAS